MQIERFSKLSQLAEVHEFDPQKELEEVKDLNDVQFETHLKRVERYQKKCPVDVMLPIPGEVPEGAAGAPGRGTASERERYQKETTLHQDARKVVERYMRSGKEPNKDFNYEEIVTKLRAGEKL